MTRYLLDTKIISNVFKQLSSARLSEWLADQRDDDLFVSSMTVAEIQCGILELPNGKRRHALEAWFAGSEGPQA